MQVYCLVPPDVIGASDSLDLELEMVVRCLVGAGNWVWVLCKSSSALTCWASAPDPPGIP